MKIIKIPSSDNEVIEFLNNTLNEVILLRDLKHEYIIEFVDAYFTKINEICIITDLAEGGSLYDLNNKNPLEYP